MGNRAKTWVLLAALSGLLLLIGGSIGGEGGLVIALGIALAVNLGTYWFSDKLAIKAARAEPADPAEHRELHAMVADLARRAGQPEPRLYVSPSPQPNAFATGRNPRHAAVCVNEGLLGLLTRDELEGVLAHELSHVYNRDILIGTIAATVATAVAFLARLALFLGDEDNPVAAIATALLAPVAAILIQFAVTRSRERQADVSGAELSGKPLALANALRKIEAGGVALARRGAEATPAERPDSAYATLYISAPLGGALRRGVAGAFRTHPPTEERVAALEELAHRRGQLV